jgi:HK97 gp10 family phage protein
VAFTARDAVRVDGLQSLRRNLKAVDKDAAKEVQVVIRDAAQIVAGRARTLAPRKTGRLAASIRGTTSGASGVVRSPLPYANVQHWGGTTGPGHSRSQRGAVSVRGTRFISKAFDDTRDQVARKLEDGMADVARRHDF